LAGSSDSPDLDARRLLEYLLAVDSAYLIVHGDRELDAGQSVAFDALVARRAAGEPVAYIVGSAGFWTLDLTVSPAVLVPRPDTETLVAAALEQLSDLPLEIVDLGTGSGAIALALASERPRWRLTATDNDAGALACARANATRLGLDNVRFTCGDWFEPLADQRFDAILSNPPYVACNDSHLRELGFEPRAALVAAAHGLADLERIVAGAPAHLKPSGWLMLEHGMDQGETVRGLLHSVGFARVETLADLADRPRVTRGRIVSDSLFTPRPAVRVWRR
jgi:release factor glutamine methyltransferase